VAALGSAGTPAAQRALRAVLTDGELPSEAREHGAMVLGMTETPDPASLSALGAAIDDGDAALGRTAELALGNAARRATDDDAAAAARKRLAERFAAAATPGDRALALKALGNAGGDGMMPALRAALASPDEEVRAAAVGSLRFVPGADADALIAEVLARDPSPWVRSEAVRAAGFRAPAALWPALVGALQGDAEVEVRLSVVHLIGDRFAQLADAVPQLRWTAAHDSDATVRGAAQKYLTPS